MPKFSQSSIKKLLEDLNRELDSALGKYKQSVNYVKTLAKQKGVNPKDLDAALPDDSDLSSTLAKIIKIQVQAKALKEIIKTNFP